MDKIILTREPIDEAAVAQWLRRFDAGALATFEGTVRAESACDKTLAALEYESYEGMAVRQMEALRNEAISKHAILDAAIVHRLGRIRLGETSILVVVASAHRAEAFAACQWIVDRVKADVPIWKKDVWADGTTSWVRPEAT